MAGAGERAGRGSVTSTEAQKNFGDVLSRVAREGRVFVTKHDRPEAVVLSIAAYEALVGPKAVELDALEREFDAALARMQMPAQQAGVDALFAAEAAHLGEAARDGAADGADG
jgi:antitoxin Phd